MESETSPFIAALPKKPEMRCIAFDGKAATMRIPGWEKRSMEDARALALKWINSNHGIEIFTIETTMTDHHAVVSIWYRSPFSSGETKDSLAESAQWE